MSGVIAALILWCGIGIAGLLWTRDPEPSPLAAMADVVFAALLGPFSLLLAYLAAHMTDGEEEDDPASTPPPPRRDR
jgi:hypothetical protein